MSGGPEPGIDQALPVILLFLIVGVLLKQLRKSLPVWFKLPYTVLMFLFGLLVTAVATELQGSLGRVGRSVDLWLGVHPHVILLVFLPPLLFESAFDMDYNVFQRVAGQALVLAVPGVFLSLGLSACYIRLFFTSYNWGWDMSLLLGSILSATDPVAVVAVLKTLGAPKKLASLIEGESLLNDGSAFVLFLIFKDMAAGHEQSFGSIVLTFSQLSLGGPLFGIVCAWVAYFILYFVYNDPLVEITGVVVAVFGVFFLSELTLHVSSVLAVVVFGLFFAKQGKYALSREVHHIGHGVWAQIGHVSNTIIFGISGLVFYNLSFTDRTIYADATNWGLLFASYAMLHVVRFIVIMTFYPCTRRMGYGLSLRECAIMWFGGLRGAVGLALGLLVLLEDNISTRDAHLLNFHVAGIVCLTMLINGTLAGAFYKWVKPYPPTSSFKIRLFSKALEVLQLELSESIHELKGKWYFKDANWDLVVDLLPDFDQITFENGHIKLDSMKTVNQCFRKARFKKLWAGGLLHARKQVRSDVSSPQHQIGASGMVDTVLTALHKRDSTDEAMHVVMESAMRQHHVGKSATVVQAAGQRQKEVQMTALNSDLTAMGVQQVQVEEEEKKSPTIKRKSTTALTSKGSMAPGLAVLLQAAPGIIKSASGALAEASMRSLKHMDVHKSEEVCQIIFTTVKAYYHAMYEDRYIDSSAMLVLLDSLDKGNEAARQYNADPGRPITVSYERLRDDILKEKWSTRMMLKLPTKFSGTRALRAVFVYSQAKRNLEALHAFIEAHERVTNSNDYRSDLDPKVTDDITDCIKNAHELLQKMRAQATVAASVLTAVMAAKVVLNEQRGKVLHLYHEEGMLDEGVKGELIDLVEARLFELHSFFPSPFILGLKSEQASRKGSRPTPTRDPRTIAVKTNSRDRVEFDESAPVKPDVTSNASSMHVAPAPGAHAGVKRAFA